MIRPQVVCLVPVRNAAADLPDFFTSAEHYCDAIVALDDGSTDETADILASSPLVKILLRNPRRETYHAWDDAANRNRLLAAAGELNPEWIVSVDTDERMDPSDANAMRRFLDTDALPGLAYGFQVYMMYRDLEHFRTRYQDHFRLFAYEPGQVFPDVRLHFAPIPTSIPYSARLKTTLRLQHIGGLTKDRRLARYEKYRQADPARRYQESYDHLLEEAQGDFLRWGPRDPGLPILAAELSLPDDAFDVLLPFSEDRPAISAIIISRNDEARIARTVSSVVAQDCPEPFEVIVVTSGTDRTAEIVRNNFPQVTLVELDRPALPGEARNAGLRVARGMYISFPGSHVELPPGSLAARFHAHELGYAMVTGSTINGTRTLSGWASYFLDHHTNLPGSPARVLSGAPAHCSYARAPLLEVGGFPEGVRTAEDTAVNKELVHRGYLAYRDPAIRLIHHSPCRNPGRLLTHHFMRGRGWARLMLQNPARDDWQIQPQSLRYTRNRVSRITHNVLRWAPEYRRALILSFPLIVAGAIATTAGVWYEILNDRLGKTDTAGAETQG